MESLAYLSQILGISFTSGINLYATVGLVGLAIRFGLIHNLPPQLNFLANEYVIGTAIILYLCEFIADKVPAFDSVWDTIHTFIRPFAAAFIALMAVGDAPMPYKIIAFLIAGSVALTAHTAKTGVRLIANTSPEPFSNSILSIAEDIGVFALLALVLTHPYIAATIVLLLLALILWQGPKLVGFVIFMIKAITTKIFSYTRAEKFINMDIMPPKFNEYLNSILNAEEKVYLILSTTFRGKTKASGYFIATDKSLILLYRKWFRITHIDLDIQQIKRMTFQNKFFIDKISFQYENKPYVMTFFKHNSRTINDIKTIIKSLDVEIVEPESAIEGLTVKTT